MKNYIPARTYKPSRIRSWYVVARRTEAVIYKEDAQHHFQFVYRLVNPRGRKPEIELDSDRPGRGASSANGTFHHALDRSWNRHETVAKKFAKKIAQALTHAARQNRFDELVLVAEPHFLGMLRDEIPASLRAKIKHEVNREYAKGSDQFLHDQIIHAISSKVA